LIAASTLHTFAEAHPAAAASLAHWRSIMKAARWANMGEVSATFSKSKVINADRIRFAVAGGAYRLICAIDFGRQIVFVKFIGTHAEYDAIDAATVARF
jgi:mRNA interferase HigB